MPDIDKINNVAVADISKLDAVTFADGQKVNNQDVSLVTDAHTLIATYTASASSSLDITSGIDSTYDVYEFILSSLHPSVDAAKVMWQSSTDGGSSYGVATTTSFYQTYNHESSGSTNLSYAAGLDAADSTSDDIYLTDGVGFDNDQTASGRILLFNPSNTTFTKHFIAEIQQSSAGNTCNCSRSSGNISTTSAVDALQFSFDSGNIDAGVIKMFGYELP
jgi:hypothetical protein